MSNISEPVNLESFIISFFNGMENCLLSRYEISKQINNKVLSGGLREKFIQDFLRKILPENVGITGVGEIISFRSNISSKEDRPQNDILLYKTNYPKLENFYLPESVLAVIEVMTKIDKSRLRDKLKSALLLKRDYNYNIAEKSTSPSRHNLENFPYLIFAYDSTELDNLQKQLIELTFDKYAEAEDITIEENMRNNELLTLIFEKYKPLIDGIFVLKKGCIQACTLPSLIHYTGQEQDMEKPYITIKDKYVGHPISLYTLYINIVELISGYCDYESGFLKYYSIFK